MGADFRRTVEVNNPHADVSCHGPELPICYFNGFGSGDISYVFTNIALYPRGVHFDRAFREENAIFSIDNLILYGVPLAKQFYDSDIIGLCARI